MTPAKNCSMNVITLMFGEHAAFFFLGLSKYYALFTDQHDIDRQTKNFVIVIVIFAVVVVVYPFC